jgi:N6-adenosine-specific RNA methylase IME4
MISTFSSLDISEALAEVIEQVASVPFQQACTLQGVGTTTGYELINAGEWESYLDGKSRKVTLRSIKARRDRLLSEAKTRPRAGNTPPRPHRHGQPVDPTLKAVGISTSAAHRYEQFNRLPEEEKERRISQGRAVIEAGKSAADAIIRQGDKKARRVQRERDLGAKQVALPNRLYGVIVADPEWQFEPWSRETGMDRAAANHYPTSVLPVIASRPVETIAADDCVLFLWATIPMLPHALVVMAAWGFDYKSQQAWGKDKFGTGYWFREKHELFLVGTRGDIPCPAPGDQWDSLVMAPRGEHSAKPELFLKMVEQYFPSLPKIELNRRGPARPGWDAWGNEAEVSP